MYSHPATRQDEWVLNKMDRPGSFVELGAYDGITHSNTLALEERGWRGILIEGYGPFAERCKQNRPRAKVQHQMIGDGHEQPFVIGGQYSGLTRYMPESFMYEHRKRRNPTMWCTTLPLADVIGTGYVDYLSLDTEGNELQILEDWIEAGGRCGLLTVEFRYDYSLILRFDELLDKIGLTLDQVRGFDLCYSEK